jgi:hypothetical protein
MTEQYPFHEQPYSPQKVQIISDARQACGKACCIADLIGEGPDPTRWAQVRDVIETVLDGRNYEVVMLFLADKSFSEIACILGISKSAAYTHYRRAVYLVRRTMGIVSPPSLLS